MKGMQVSGAMYTVFAVVVGLLSLVIIEGPLTDAASVSTTVDVTGAAASSTSATATLNAVSKDAATAANPARGAGSFYDKVRGMSVARKSGNAACGAITRNGDTVSVALSPPGSSPTQTTCTLTYRAPIADTTQLQIFVILPFFVLLGVVGAALAGGAMRAGLGGMGSPQSAMQTTIEILVMIVLIPIILAFQNSVETAYKDASRYVGLQVTLSLVVIAYMLQLLGAGIGTVRGRLGSGGGSKKGGGPRRRRASMHMRY